MQEIIDNWTSTILALVALSGVLYNWFTQRGDKALEELEAFKEKVGSRDDEFERSLASHDRRVQKLEDALGHLPNVADFHRLELAMTELVGTVKVLTQKVDTSEAVVSRVDAYLRESGK